MPRRFIHSPYAINPRLVAVLLFGAAIRPAWAEANQDASKAHRPNVILMMADDLGWGDPGFQGNRVIHTPHLDAMAAAGLRFTRFYSAGPVCSPTRGSCVTGRHPLRYGITHANVGRMPAEEFTLAELLKAQGYRTGHFGKWHLGTFEQVPQNTGKSPYRDKGEDRYAPPWEHGFDVCFSTERKVPTRDPLLRPKGVRRSTWWDPVNDLAGADSYGWPYWSNRDKITDGLRGDDSRLIMDRAIPFIREAVKAKRPFFAVIWFHAPHLPVVAGARHTKRYRELDKYRQHHHGCISAMDEQVGRLRKELRDLRVSEDTMLWFCSDNGPEGNETAPGSTGGLRGRKRDLFEGGVRVPGLVEWPANVKTGSITDVPACTSDYLPTVLDVLGIEMPDDRPTDGVSLLGLLEGEMKQRPKPIAFEFRTQIALVDNRFKLIGTSVPKTLIDELRGNESGRRDTGLAPRFMLFDLIADPAETRDLADQHPEIVKRMAATLDAWRVSCRKSLAGDDYR